MWLHAALLLDAQVQQLILDPAIENEFKQLREQLALRVAETEAAKAAYEGQAFTQVSMLAGLVFCSWKG